MVRLSYRIVTKRRNSSNESGVDYYNYYRTSVSESNIPYQNKDFSL